MATSQNASISINAQATPVKNGRSTTTYIISNLQFQNGTTVGLADKNYYEYRTISAGSGDALDFAGGGLIDGNGDAITWVDMVGLVISAPSTNTLDINVGAHANAFNFGIGTSATMKIRPGETKVLIGLALDPGYAVTAGSGDTIKVAFPTGVAQSYEIWAIGRSA